MKRLIIFVIFMLFAAPVFMLAANDELNAEQLALRSDIMDFLKEEGFTPEIDSYGDIAFKSEGQRYYISISSVDENPMYVTLFRSFNNPEEYSADVLLMATKSLNRYKGVKVTCFDNSFSISAELYLRDSELFKSCFYKLKSQIDNVKSDVMSECKNVGGGLSASISEIPFIVTKMEVANVENDGTIIQDYGKTIYDFKTQYLKPRITIRPYKTSGTYTLYVKLYKDNVLERNTSSSPENYTYSSKVTISGAANQVLDLPGWGNKESGTWKIGTYRYEIWINDYCIGSKTFKVI